MSVGAQKDIPDQRWNVSLIQTKLAPPRLPAGFVRRQGLATQLNAGLNRCLTIVIAPAGFGKTTLLASWRETLLASKHLVAWLSLDEDDDDPQQFGAYLVATLCRASEALGQQAQRLLQNDPLTPLKTVISVLLNDIAACGQQVFAIFDDIDRLASPAIHAMVSRLLRYAPDNLHIVLGARSEPALAVGQLRIQEKLLRIDIGDLRFSIEEAQAFFGQSSGVALDRSSVELLNNATEGWVTGLQLALLALNETGDAVQVARGLAGARLGIDRYLDDAVLSHLPAPILHFLLYTSILDRLSAGVCDVVIGEGTSSWEALDWLDRNNVFIRPLDDERQWFRYHPLLSGALRRRLGRQSAEQLPSIHRRASHWFAAASLWPEAVKHALAACDFEQAAQWAENCAMAMVDRSDMRTLLSWTSKLPSELIERRLRLRTAKAWALALSLQTAEASREAQALAADVIQQRSVKSPAFDHACLIEVVAVRAGIAGLNDDSDQALTLGRAVFEAPLPESPWVNRFAEAALVFGLLYSGHFDEVRRLRKLAAADPADSRAPIYASVYRQSMFGLAALVEGDLAEAVPILESAHDHAERSLGRNSGAAALPAGYLAAIYYERNDLPRALDMVAGRAATAMETCPLGSLLRYTWASLRLYERDGNLGAALAIIEDAQQVAAERNWLRLRVGCDAEAVRLYIKQGKLAQARRTAEALRTIMCTQSQPRTGSFLETWVSFCSMQVRLLIAENRFDEAVALLTRLRDEAAVGSRWYLDVQLSVQLATALEQSGASSEALVCLDHALEIAQSTGMVNSLVDEGPLLRRLLVCRRRTADNVGAIDPIFIDRLLSAFDALPPRVDCVDTPASRVALSILSAREIEILDHIARGLSNKEIGRALRVAPETVKWHLKNIFEKLNVGSRVEAVQTGLGIVPSLQRSMLSPGALSR